MLKSSYISGVCTARLVMYACHCCYVLKDTSNKYGMHIHDGEVVGIWSHLFQPATKCALYI